jgi:site-specific recombinase XerC
MAGAQNISIVLPRIRLAAVGEWMSDGHERAAEVLAKHKFLIFLRNRNGRLAKVTDVSASAVQAWMDDMAAADLALSTMRARQSTVSSFCAWLVKREILAANPVARLERPPHHREPPKQIPGSSIMDALVEAAKKRRRPRDVAMFLIMRYTGMRRESVAWS